jgi:hypothetical protein
MASVVIIVKKTGRADDARGKCSKPPATERGLLSMAPREPMPVPLDYRTPPSTTNALGTRRARAFLACSMACIVLALVGALFEWRTFTRYGSPLISVVGMVLGCEAIVAQRRASALALIVIALNALTAIYAVFAFWF